MIEHVAQAILVRDMSWNQAVDCARAAIAAMREPTNSMLDAGEEKTWDPSSDRPYIGHFDLKFAWYAMIDKALEDELPS
jgi:hypothetical protein